MSVCLAITPLFGRVLASANTGWFAISFDWGLDGGIEQAIVYLGFGGLVIGSMAVLLQNLHLTQKVKRLRQAEAELQLSESHHRALLNALPDLIMRINRAGVYLEFLASVDLSVLGDLTDWVGTHVTDRLPPDLAQKRMDAIQQALTTQSIQVYEQELWVDGAPQMEQVRVVPYSKDDVLLLIQNISDRKRAEERLRRSEERFRCAIAMAPLPIMIHAEDGEVLYINSTWTELTGYTHQDIPTTQAWAQLAYGENAEKILKDVITRKYSSDSHQDGEELTITTADNSQRIWKFNSALLEQLSDGRRVAISMAVDVTQNRQVEKALRDSEERYRSIYLQAAVGFANGTIEGRFVDVNPRFCQMLGYSREELLAKSITEIIHPDDRAQSKVLAQRLFANEAAYFFHEKRYLRKDGSYFWANTGTSVVRDAQGNPKHLLTVIRDISDRVRVEEQLKYDAFHDQLTGLPNRSLLMERLELALKRTKRHPEIQLAVLFLDLDNFKVINDSLGHHVGDELLLAISAQLKLVIRETDLAARLGGDEFVVLLEDINDLAEAVMVAERILAMMKSPITIAERQLFPGVSIGIAMSAPHYQAAELLRDADVAMYWAKHNGRGQYIVFDPKMQLQVIQRLQIENNLRKALESDTFLLYYQPIVNLKTQKIEAFEALIRWQHPDRGLLTSEQFIDIAEEIGLTLPIGEWVLRTACQQLVVWQTQFPDRFLSLSINLSSQQLNDSLLLKLEETLALHRPRKNSFMLEIAESILAQSLEVTQGLLNRVRANDVNIVIDDFGTGYSCLPYLHQLPVDAIKIDYSFINPAVPDMRSQMITESIITLCKSLDLKTVANGLETLQQLSWLERIGCDAGQGAYFARPMAAEQATELLHQETISPFISG
ncbi:MAG: EAL domain-containing protein [Cyanobacteria bacterium P01_F01_bin.13]